MRGSFDFIHAFIVFQHIPVARGSRILERMVGMLEPGGVGAIQLKFASESSCLNPTTELGRIGSEGASLLKAAVKTVGRPARDALRRFRSEDPAMQMNAYPLNAVFAILSNAGVKSVFSDFTDHGGELGVFLYFRKPTV